MSDKRKPRNPSPGTQGWRGTGRQPSWSNGLGYPLDQLSVAAPYQLEQTVFLAGDQALEMHGTMVDLDVSVSLGLADEAQHRIYHKKVNIVNRCDCRVVFKPQDHSDIGIGKLNAGQMVRPAIACRRHRQHFNGAIK